jgi:hypothetical protein
MSSELASLIEANTRIDGAFSYSNSWFASLSLFVAHAERTQLLGGVSLAMAADVAEATQIERPPRGREQVPVQLSGLLLG